MPVIISAQQLRYLDHIAYPDIAIEENQATFILGESGSGKSSLFRLFNGTASAAGGTILYRERPQKDYDPVKLRREVLLCGQTVYLFNDNVRGNFEEYHKFRDADCPSSELISEYLEICCLDFPLDTACSTLSGGERQRVFIALGLSFKPKVLLLDEPTSALDEQTASRLIKSIKDFCKMHEISLVLVCHDRRIAAEHADAIIELSARPADRLNKRLTEEVSSWTV